MLPSEIQFAYDMNSVIEEAYLVGRSGNIFQNNFTILNFLTGELKDINSAFNSNNYSIKDMVDEKFKEKKKHHVFQDDNNVYNGKYFSCKLVITENNTNKYFIIQLLKNDSKNSFSLFTRWGKIGSDGQQKVESVDSTSGPKLFMKKYTEKINKGYSEEGGEKKEEKISKKSKESEELL
mgnify:CR=1 FL=1